MALNESLTTSRRQTNDVASDPRHLRALTLTRHIVGTTFRYPIYIFFLLTSVLDRPTYIGQTDIVIGR